MEPYETRAVLVRQVDTGESDRVVTLLTEDRGKVSAIARGARRSRKRFGGALSFFVLAEAELKPRRGSNLQLLARYDALETFPGISSQLGAIVHASYLTEVVGALCPEDHPEPQLLGILLEAYRRLGQRGPNPTALRVLEHQILTVAGLAPQTRACAGCGRPLDPADEAPAGFDVGKGGLVCPVCALPDDRVRPETVTTLQRLGDLGLDEAEQLVLSAETHAELRRALTGSVVHAVGRPLKSLAFLRQVAR